MNGILFALLAAALTGVALYLVAHPILVRSRGMHSVPTSAMEELDELLAQRDAAFQALRELNFDRRVGKIADEDFHAFESNLKQVAADALRALDSWESEVDAEQEASRQRFLARSEMDQLPAADSRSCQVCGQPMTPEDRFCARCGAEVAGPSTAQSLCPQCGHHVEQDDRFCGACGQSLRRKTS